MSTAPMESLVDQLQALPPARCLAILGRVDERFKRSGSSAEEDGPDTLQYAVLARHLLYYALSLGERGRSPTGTLQPQWSEIRRRYQKFLSDSPSLVPLLPEIEEDNLRRFCSFSTRRQGSRLDRFYTGIALFLLHEHDRKALIGEQLMKLVVPACEAHFLEEVRRELGHLINREADDRQVARPFPKLPPPRRARPYREVQVNFACGDEWLERFNSFAARYRVPADDGVHLIVYRGREGCPEDLVKSFLALLPGQEDSVRGQEHVFRSTHVYQPASEDLADPRLSRGWVVPLEKGLYIVGGQKAEAEWAGRGGGRAPRKPFRAIETLHFSWQSLESQLLFGLAMSVNNDGTPLITRICAIPTPIDRSDALQLGEIRLPMLAESIEEDLRRERTLPEDKGVRAELLQRFRRGGTPEARSKLARAIAYFCNNIPLTPRDWGVQPPLDQGSDGAELQVGPLAAALDRLVKGGKVFAPVDRRELGFWGAVRLGPLINDGT